MRFYLFVPPGDTTQGEFPTWFTLYRGDVLVQEDRYNQFQITEPGDYHMVGMFPNGTKLTTQTITVTPGMLTVRA